MPKTKEYSKGLFWFNLCILAINNYLCRVRDFVRIALLLIGFCLVLPTAQAGSPVKGFEALLLKDYFKAKKIFSKGMKYNPEVSAYGLAVIYSRNDHPFYHKDSAYRYIVIADTSWQYAKERKKEKWAMYTWTRAGIDSMKQVISDQFFREARKTHSVEGYTTFMAQHPWSRHMAAVLESRDSLAFFQAMAKNTSTAYKEFLTTYPSSSYAAMADDNFYNSQFYELTGVGSIDSYLQFIEEHPNSPMLPEAERAVFKLVTEPNTLQAYELFVLGYGDNRNVEQGWAEFYQLYISEYSCERIRLFLEKYPQVPQKESIEQDLTWCDYDLLPNSIESFYEQEGRLCGFMNVEGKQIIPCKYEFVGAFQEGLAMVIQEGKYGFIDKLGNWRIPCNYDGAVDFHEGRAVVEKDGKYGMIDRNNRLLLPFIYEEIGEMSEGRIYVSKGDLYGYANENGTLVIPEKFNEAFDFADETAKVEENGKYGYINRDGAFVIEANYEELSPFTDSLMLCTVDGRNGLITRNGTVVIEAIYEQIGYFKEGLALVAHGDTVEYININGEVVISKGYKTYPNFLHKGEFYQGSAIVMNRKGKYGKVNPFGNVVTDFKYDNLGLGGKFFPFEKEEMWGLMSSSNSILISPTYESIDVVDEAYIIARLGDSLGVLDPNGNLLMPIVFKEIEYLKDGAFVVNENDKYALFLKEKRISEAEYDAISLFNDDFVLLVKGKDYAYFDLKRSMLIKTKESE